MQSGRLQYTCAPTQVHPRCGSPCADTCSPAREKLALRPDQQGAVLVFVLLTMLIMATIGAAAVQVALTETSLAANYRDSWRAYYAAEGTAGSTLGEVTDLVRSLGRLPTEAELGLIEPPVINGTELSDFDLVSSGAPMFEPLQTGYFQGLQALSQSLEVDVTIDTVAPPASRASMSLGVFVDIIPVYEFAVLYERDLELMPDSPMFLNGRLHGNGDLYLAPGSTLTSTSITAAGDIYNLRKDQPWPPSGDVRISNAAGDFPAMAGLDSRSESWRNDALRRWDGNVRSRDHGVQRLNITIPDPRNPRKIIEPGYDDDTPEDLATKIFYKSGMSINILNGQGFDALGNPIPLLDALTFTVIDDQREEKEMLTVEVDVEKLAELPDYPGGPSVVYIGSFRPGNGIPDWDVTGPTAWETRDHLQAIADSNPGLLGQIVGDVVMAVDSAISACGGPLPNVLIAALHITAAIVDLDLAVTLGLLDPYEAAVYVDRLQRVASCQLGGEDRDWPAEWEGYLPPYAGGNTEFAVKLTSGAELPDSLTIVSANPVYIHGNYNSVDQRPAAVMADAITVLSGAWGVNDLTYSRKSLASRVASPTTVNAALMAGHTETLPGEYGGGLENLVRLLEDWSGRELRFRGSLVSLWLSQHATGPWRRGDPVYTDPIRNWSFDTDLLDPANHPPETPSVLTMRVFRWDWR
ncbi:MAG TPA: PilX N-terminal domain-containing pilus assembly protein [Acidobacteriota bacterium]